MPDVIKVSHHTELAPTKLYPHATFPFPSFNPVQSRVFEFYDKPSNAVIAAATSAGKTVCAEMFIADEVRRRGGKGMYLAPLRALSQEKIDDWTDSRHHFAGLNLAICTGDYRLTAERRGELERADIIIMTSEMLNSRGRNHRSENNSWLRDVSTLIVDESHLLTVPGRGDHLESGLMKYAELNPEGRIVLLSATMPNVDEIGRWISSLTGRDTYLLESSYRPCKLNVHYEKYIHHWNYDMSERGKVQAALRILQQHPRDKFLFFVHTKRTGEMLRDRLDDLGVECEYHNADLEKSKRNNIESRFKEDPKLRAIVATSSLAWGLNLPARRVVILGVHRGLSEVENYDIAQMMGRAGRPQFDPEGDAYILLPNNDKFGHYLAKLQKPEPIRSQMLDSKVLCFHIISEIHHGNIRTYKDIHRWFDRTLAKFQNKSLDHGTLEAVIKSLTMCGALKEEDGVFSVSATGTISSLFYYSPFDVADLAKNWKKVFERGLEENDGVVATALGAVSSQYSTIVSAAEKLELEQFTQTIRKAKLDKLFGGDKGISDGQIKAAYCYWLMLGGKSSGTLAGFLRTLQNDFDREAEVLGAIDTMSLKMAPGTDYFKMLALRMKYGVGVEMVELCRLTGIGKAKARRLWDANLRTLDAVAKDCPRVITALNMSRKKAEELCAEAAKLAKV